MGSLPGLLQEFPMYVVRVRDLLKMKELRPHQQLLAANMLVEFVEGMGKVLFLSHQWLSFKLPDPDFEQLRILIEALQNIITGTVLVQNHLRIQGTGGGLVRAPQGNRGAI